MEKPDDAYGGSATDMHGRGANDGHCGFTDWRCTITVAGYSMDISTNADNGTFYQRNKDENITIIDTDEDVNTSGEYEKYVTFEVRIPQSMLNTEVTASIRGVWWRRWGIAPDENVNVSYPVTCNADRPTLTYGDVRFTESGGEPAIEIDWNSKPKGGTDNIYTFGEICMTVQEINWAQPRAVMYIRSTGARRVAHSCCWPGITTSRRM